MIKKWGSCRMGDHQITLLLLVAIATVFLPYKIPVYILQTFTLPIQYQIPCGGLLNVLWGTVCPGGQSLVVVILDRRSIAFISMASQTSSWAPDGVMTKTNSWIEELTHRGSGDWPQQVLMMFQRCLTLVVHTFCYIPILCKWWCIC